jgi:hypothetical protein
VSSAALFGSTGGLCARRRNDAQAKPGTNIKSPCDQRRRSFKELSHFSPGPARRHRLSARGPVVLGGTVKTSPLRHSAQDIDISAIQFHRKRCFEALWLPITATRLGRVGFLMFGLRVATFGHGFDSKDLG